MQKHYEMKDVKNIINMYIQENELMEGARRGHVRLDPLFVNLTTFKPGQNDVKKEYIFKNLNHNLHNAYVTTLVDQDQITKDRQRFFKGDVPKVDILSQKINNKKVTTLSGLEMYQIDYDELTTYLQHKCASSVTIGEIEHLSTVKCQKFMIKVQGSQTKLIEEILTERYMVPKKYITVKDTVP